VWKLPPEQWEDVALAVGSAFKKADSFDLVWLDDETLSKSLVLISDTDGGTPVADLVSKHADLVALNYRTLGAIALHAAERICDKHWRKVHANELKQIVANAVVANRVKLANLKEDLRKEIEPFLAAKK